MQALEAQLVAAAIADRSAYESVRKHFAPEDFTPLAKPWWGIIGEWYARDRQSRSIDRSSLVALGTSRLGSGKPAASVLGFLHSLPVDVSATNIAQIALELKRHSTGMELAAAIAGGEAKKLAKLVPLYAELHAATSLPDKQAVEWDEATDIERLFDEVGDAQRIPLAPMKLNERVGGGALPGHHIILYARPEMGKSCFSVNFAAMMAVKQKQRVLYVSNEDQVNVLKSRAVARVADTPIFELDKNRERVIAAYRESGAEERIRFVQMYRGGPEDLRRPIEEFEPAVLIFDQIRNAGEGDSTVERLDHNGQAVRRLLVEYGMVGLSITQAAVSAEGKDWLGMEDIDSSKTGLPGSGDLLLGMGGKAETVQRGQRTLSIAKNKLFSGDRAREGMMIEMDTSRSVVR